jgi:nicotinamide-nucleotide amidase
VVVAVGDELLYGHTVNTNGAWLGQALSTLGLRVARQEVVGDRREEIQGAVDRGLEVGDVVILTGGLGPTPDDLTRPAVAEFLGFDLHEDPALVEVLRERFRARGYDDVPPNNRKMAQVPVGGGLLPNPVGAAPGLVFPLPEGRNVILLPGIPGEMRGIFSGELVPFLRGLFGPRLLQVFFRFIYTTGIPESLLARELELLLPGDLGPVTVSYLPDPRGVKIRLTAAGVGEAEAESRFEEMEERLEGLLRPFRYRAESGDLAQALGEALMARGATVAAAESCTGGLISKRITDRPGSSRYFLGGIVAYSDEGKMGHLGVSSEMLNREGAVSRPVAEAMALGVAEGFGATAGIGVTGVAGPDGGSEEKPVGTVWYAASLDGEVSVRMERFLGDREMVRERTAQAAMALLLRILEGRSP